MRARGQLEREHLPEMVELLCNAIHRTLPEARMDVVLIRLRRAFAGPPFTSSDKRVRAPLQEYGNDRFALDAYDRAHKRFPELYDCRPVSPMGPDSRSKMGQV